MIGLISWPSQLNRLCYFYWISQMCSYLILTNNDVWSIIKNGWTWPTQVIKTDVVEHKVFTTWNKEKHCLSSLNCQRSHLLISNLSSLLQKKLGTSWKINMIGVLLIPLCLIQIELCFYSWFFALMASYLESVSSSSSYWTNTGDNDKFSLQESYDQFFYKNLKLKKGYDQNQLQFEGKA